MRIKLALFLFGFILMSCQKTVVFEQKISFGENGWNRFTKQTFEFEIVDFEKRYDIFIEAKVDDEYFEQYLPLYMQANYPNGEIRTEKYSIKIKDSYNRFLKESSQGSRFYSQCIQKGKKFPSSGRYTYEFEHGNSRLILKGIKEFAFIIKHSEVTD